jgi:hypothetical protein
MDSEKLLEYAKARVEGGSPYAFAFGIVWTWMNKSQQQEIIEYAEKKMLELQAEKESN